MVRHANLRGRKLEEAAGLDDLESLVHHGGGVDGDALSHHPGWVLEGLGGGDRFELLKRGVTEGTTGGGEPDLFYFGGRASAHGLMDGVVFGVDGEESYVVLAGCGEDEFAGGYEALLVGEADGLAGADCGVGGFEAGYSDYRRDDEVDLRECGCVDASGGAVDYFDVAQACGFEESFEGSGELFGGDGDELWTPALALGEGGIEVCAGGESDGM